MQPVQDGTCARGMRANLEVVQRSEESRKVKSCLISETMDGPSSLTFFEFDVSKGESYLSVCFLFLVLSFSSILLHVSPVSRWIIFLVGATEDLGTQGF